MKKFFLKHILIVILLIFPYLTFTLEGVTFIMTFGGGKQEYAQYIIELKEGGFVACGDGFSFSLSTDIYLVKMNAIGEIEWFRTFGGEFADTANSVQQTDDGGFVIVGESNSFNNNRLMELYVIKTDSEGNLMWSKTFGGLGNYSGQAVQQTGNGDFIIAGWLEAYNDNLGKEILLLKIDYDGNEIWQKTIGGLSDDIATSIVISEDGSYVICGRTQSFGEGKFDGFLLKVDTNGNEIWRRTYGYEGNDPAYTVKMTDDKGFIICGFSDSLNEAGNYDAYLVKTDSEGKRLWFKTYSGPMKNQEELDIFDEELSYEELNPQEKDDRAFSVAQAVDGGFIIVGDTTSFGVKRRAILIIKTDINGKQEWYRKYNGVIREEASCIQRTNDDGFIICGTTESTGSGKTDFIFIKISPEGKIKKEFDTIEEENDEDITESVSDETNPDESSSVNDNEEYE